MALNDGTEWIIQRYLFHCKTLDGQPYTTTDIQSCAVLVSREDVSQIPLTPTPTPSPVITQEVVNNSAHHVNGIEKAVNYILSLPNGWAILIGIIVIFLTFCWIMWNKDRYYYGGYGGGYGGGYESAFDDDDDDRDPDFVDYEWVGDKYRDDGTLVRGHLRHSRGGRFYSRAPREGEIGYKRIEPYTKSDGGYVRGHYKRKK